MKHILLFLSLFIASQIYGQETWNACNSTVTIIPPPSYDSTFVLSAPSRAALAKGMANWTPSTSSAASYLVYTALLTQSGTDAPVATVLENTLGGTVVWSYVDVGLYAGTLTGAFAGNATFSPSIGIDQNGYGIGSPYSVYKDSDDAIAVNSYSDYTDTPANDRLSSAYIEIRVYNP